MGLFLKREEMWDMPLNGTGEGKRITRWFGNLAWVVIGFLLKIAFRYRVVGRDSLRAFHGESGVLIVSNHTSYFDVVMMYLAARPTQWVRFLGKADLFDHAGGLLGQILSRVGAFPVKRDSADRSAIKRASRFLKEKEVVGILPEGTRRHKGNKDPNLHSGAAFIAKMGKAPILPMTVRGVEKIKQPGRGVRFPKVTVEYGTPILLEDFDFLPKDDRLEGCTWYAMRECFALFYQVPADEVDMVSLFPKTRDYTADFAEHPIPRRASAEVVAMLREKSAQKGLSR